MAWAGGLARGWGDGGKQSWRVGVSGPCRREAGRVPRRPGPLWLADQHCSRLRAPTRQKTHVPPCPPPGPGTSSVSASVQGGCGEGCWLCHLHPKAGLGRGWERLLKLEFAPRCSPCPRPAPPPGLSLCPAPRWDLRSLMRPPDGPGFRLQASGPLRAETAPGRQEVLTPTTCPPRASGRRAGQEVQGGDGPAPGPAPGSTANGSRAGASSVSLGSSGIRLPPTRCRQRLPSPCSPLLLSGPDTRSHLWGTGGGSFPLRSPCDR